VGSVPLEIMRVIVNRALADAEARANAFARGAPFT
jgi:hypothetical protein